ncbi:PIN domain-containing protein [Oryzibacter oryziterrae]|uniref:PIN domain-containing protein n=1 Tax=Oryzibacter oryziterrae TaxID=2766474 RepID=UPI001F372057|nr:type II toxin-antitoxin system VapC family toxin [Oryzibacter oryziterrae]
MIGIDTNVLARAILEDDPVWTPIAQTFLTQRLSAAEPGYVNQVTLVELVWTLRKTGKLGRAQLARVIAGLLAAENIVVERAELVARALRSYEIGGAGFADYLIAELNLAAGVTTTVTIDGKAANSPLFTPLS